MSLSHPVSFHNSSSATFNLSFKFSYLLVLIFKCLFLRSKKYHILFLQIDLLPTTEICVGDFHLIKFFWLQNVEFINNWRLGELNLIIIVKKNESHFWRWFVKIDIHSFEIVVKLDFLQLEAIWEEKYGQFKSSCHLDVFWGVETSCQITLVIDSLLDEGSLSDSISIFLIFSVSIQVSFVPVLIQFSIFFGFFQISQNSLFGLFLVSFVRVFFFA